MKFPTFFQLGSRKKYARAPKLIRTTVSNHQSQEMSTAGVYRDNTNEFSDGFSTEQSGQVGGCIDLEAVRTRSVPAQTVKRVSLWPDRRRHHFNAKFTDTSVFYVASH
jgi:hypothetical protein